MSDLKNTALGDEIYELPVNLGHHRLHDAKRSAIFLNYSLAHFRRLYRTGKIPAPIRIGGRKCGWPEHLLLDLAANRMHK